jgi:hypothetical protein
MAIVHGIIYGKKIQHVSTAHSFLVATPAGKKRRTAAHYFDWNSK